MNAASQPEATKGLHLPRVITQGKGGVVFLALCQKSFSRHIHRVEEGSWPWPMCANHGSWWTSQKVSEKPISPKRISPGFGRGQHSALTDEDSEEGGEVIRRGKTVFAGAKLGWEVQLLHLQPAAQGQTAPYLLAQGAEVRMDCQRCLNILPLPHRLPA